jgi:hypothetical protein
VGRGDQGHHHHIERAVVELAGIGLLEGGEAGDPTRLPWGLSPASTSASAAASARRSSKRSIPTQAAPVSCAAMTWGPEGFQP